MRPDRLLPTSIRSTRRAAFAIALLLPLCAAAVTNSGYAYRFALDTRGGSEAWRVELTPAIYAVLSDRSGLRDLVVVNAQGREVPFAALPAAPPRAHPYSLEARLLPLPVDTANTTDGVRVQRGASGDIVIEQPRIGAAARPTRWLLDARRAVSLESIEFDPSALTQDLRAHFSVDASSDLQQWETRSEDKDIVSVKRGADTVQQRRLSVGGAPARYYRVRLIDGDAAWSGSQTPAVTLTGSFTDPLADRAAPRQWLTLRAAPIVKAAGRGVDYDYTLPAVLPLEAARVTLADANTAARFSLLGVDDAAGTAPLATITAVRLGEAKADAPVIAFDTVRLQHLRLHTDTPLPRPPALALGWRADIFVFLAEGSGPYSLLAGSYAARRGDYPVDAALEKIRPADAGPDWQPPLAALGARSDIGGAAALLPPKAPYDWTRLLLWLVLAGGALLIVGMALSLLKQSRRDNGRT